MGLSRQEYWSGLPFPPLGDLLSPRIEPASPAWQADSSLSHLEVQLRCLSSGKNWLRVLISIENLKFSSPGLIYGDIARKGRPLGEAEPYVNKDQYQRKKCTCEEKKWQGCKFREQDIMRWADQAVTSRSELRLWLVSGWAQACPPPYSAYLERCRDRVEVTETSGRETILQGNLQSICSRERKDGQLRNSGTCLKGETVGLHWVVADSRDIIVEDFAGPGAESKETQNKSHRWFKGVTGNCPGEEKGISI